MRTEHRQAAIGPYQISGRIGAHHFADEFLALPRALRQQRRINVGWIKDRLALLKKMPPLGYRIKNSHVRDVAPARQLGLRRKIGRCVATHIANENRLGIVLGKAQQFVDLAQR